MADYTRPIREELARAGGLLERGLTRKSQHALADKELDFAQKVRMTGLGMEKERLDIAGKGAESARKTAGLQRTKLRQDIKAKEDAAARLKRYVDPSIIKLLEKGTGVTLTTDFDSVSSFAGEDVAKGLLGTLPPERTTVNDDGTVSNKITNEQFLQNLGLLIKVKELTGGTSKLKSLKTLKDGTIWGFMEDGTSYNTGLKAKVEPGKDTPAQKRDKKKFDALVSRRLALVKKRDYGYEKDVYGTLVRIPDPVLTEMTETISDLDRQIENWNKPKKKRGTLDQEFREATGKKPQMSPVNRPGKKTDWRTYAVE